MNEGIIPPIDLVGRQPAVDRKRLQDQFRHPRLTLDKEGNIIDAAPAALRLLEHSTLAEVDRCFFTHVHGKNLRQVMSDIADMVHRGRTRASWLLRLRTGRGRWRWYKVSVRSLPAGAPREIQLTVRDIYEW